MNTPLKVFLIGLDGGTFRIIHPAITGNRLPNIKKLLKTGSSGVLTSTIPPATIPAFPTLMTGKNPGKHGVFDFMHKKGDTPHLVDGTNIHGETLWRILSNQGKRCIVMNVPLTYPPEDINGIVISGMMTPAGRPFTHPRRFAKTIERLTKRYTIRFDSSIAERNLKQFVANLHEMINKRKAVMQYLLDHEEWDLFTILFRATDIVQHHLWRDQDAVISIYEAIDRIIGELLEREPNAHVFIFSDHGFTPLEHSFHVNIYLKSLGLLKIKQRESSVASHKTGNSHHSRREVIIERTLRQIGLTRSRLRGFLPSTITRIIGRLLGKRLRRYVPATHLEVDAHHSKAYFSKTVTAETQSVMLSPKKRDEYGDLVKIVKKKLSEVKDPNTGKPVVKQVFHRSEIYHGPFVEQAPDIIMLLEEGYKATTTLSGTKIIEAVPVIQGTHSIEGIFIAAGPTIKQATEVSQIHIQDLAPTILHLMQTPIPEDVDGEVKKEIFTEESIPFKQEPRFFTPDYAKRRSVPLSRSEEEEIKDRLRSLGYID